MRKAEPGSTLITLFIVALVALLASIVFTGCSTSEIRSPVVQQIIRMRTGYESLTNRVCVSYTVLGSCKEFNTKVHDLRDASTRRMLIDFSFRCSIAGRRFKIHPNKPGFARYDSRVSCFLCKRESFISEEVLLEGNLDYLVQADTHCWSEKTYPDGVK